MKAAESVTLKESLVYHRVPIDLRKEKIRKRESCGLKEIGDFSLLERRICTKNWNKRRRTYTKVLTTVGRRISQCETATGELVRLKTYVELPKPTEYIFRLHGRRRLYSSDVPVQGTYGQSPRHVQTHLPNGSRISYNLI